MAMAEPTKVIKLDLQSALVEDPKMGHNRWHPGILPIAAIDSGEVVRVDLRDGLDR